uniref:hypothetical protein n=1 Tax=Aquimarina sp. I32.4 TaxID=2053903 RepID=UPI0013050361
KPEEGLQIPNPSSIITGMGLIPAIARIPGFGELVPLFVAADVMSTKVAHEIINEFTEDSLLAWERAKQGGLNQALIFVQNSQGAKMLELNMIEFVSQEAHEDFLKGNIISYLDLLNYQPEEDSQGSNYYTYFFYTNKENAQKKYLIDSIFLRE